MKNKLKGYNWVPGTKNEQNSYRSELAGINRAFSCIKVIVDYTKITDGSIVIALDGEAALDSVEDELFLKIK